MANVDKCRKIQKNGGKCQKSLNNAVKCKKMSDYVGTCRKCREIQYIIQRRESEGCKTNYLSKLKSLFIY